MGSLIACSPNNSEQTENGDTDEKSSNSIHYSTDDFVMGADLSYVNQILDHGGTYSDSGSVENPYQIFSEHGANVVRLRLWHNPGWVQEEVYEEDSIPMYSGLEDVKKSIEQAKEHDMAVTLDFHYSDFWADPDRQDVPEAWQEITDLEVLQDSVYNYTQRVLEELDSEGLMPEFVQVGNETNCGMMITNARDDFPPLDGCEDHWENLGAVINSGIDAVRDVGAESDVDPQIILHIAQPENVEWWFDHIMDEGGVSDFDIIGLSYYSHFSETPMDELDDYISDFRRQFDRKVMIVETAYPWTTDNADDYGNIFGEDALEEGYPATKDGQRQYLIDLTQLVIDGGGSGVMYWEPTWISSDMKDLWGTGSSWENNALFDFDGKLHRGIDFMTYDYEF